MADFFGAEDLLVRGVQAAGGGLFEDRTPPEPDQYGVTYYDEDGRAYDSDYTRIYEFNELYAAVRGVVYARSPEEFCAEVTLLDTMIGQLAQSEYWNSTQESEWVEDRMESLCAVRDEIEDLREDYEAGYISRQEYAQKAWSKARSSKYLAEEIASYLPVRRY